nr:mucin-2 [Kogia breviceps]
MGLPLARLVALCLTLTWAGGSELQREGRTRNHGHSVCSTWGDSHYKTFDGDVFRFPGLCDYNFASDCREAYQEFAVHLKRGPGRSGGHPQVEYILLTVKDDAIYLTSQLAVVNGAMVSSPYYSPGLLIERSDVYIKVYSRAGLTLMWNREDSVMLELDSKFRNHTCGLCGDYNGLQTYSEFLSDGVLFSPIEFGNMQKINKPEVCDGPQEVSTPQSCSEHRAECERLLTDTAFEDCWDRVPLELHVQACMQDRCQCPHGTSCICSTIAEFSRQCSHAGGRPRNWRTASLCPKSCPRTMVYLESGSPCMDTCSHLEVSSLCEEHRMDGCFCPEGTVYDDIKGGGCIPVNQCHCKLHGHLYAPGQQITNNCEQCVCSASRWVCQDLQCPRTCALEGGAHITTFDGRKYTFHGDCYYVLIKDALNDSYAVLGELTPCGSTDKQTCLKTVVLLADNKKNVVVFKLDGSVLLNELQVNLPHVTASFSIFQPSSHHLVVTTAFGLRLQAQLGSVMQLFLTLDHAAQGLVQGLCGNFNGLESDDFQTAAGLVEATGAGFANTWKAQPSCHDKLDWLDDPCSLNIESANYAEHWCSLLKKSETPFSKCHSAVDPAEYYKRCKYDTCNCQSTEDCMCAALSSYAHACAIKGVMLWGWRERVCNKDVDSCPRSQVFLYNLTTCQQTCRSLSESDAHCIKGFAPVDGCGCPDHTFLDEKGRCVPLAKCSCYHRGLYLEAGEVILRQEKRCVCRNGRLHCLQVKLLGQSCTAPKIHVDCNNLTTPAIRSPRPVSCQTLAAGYYQTECVSGCVCPEGLIDDGRGGCVVEEACPCMHNKDLYFPGDKIRVDCNTCTCQKGRWACTQTLCHGSCTIYGNSHYITFDGKYYDFDGPCSYVAVQDFCGQNSSLGSFSIVTEKVPCGTTGVTCSKAIKIFLGRTELKLEDEHHTVIQRDVGHRVAYTTREVGQYLVVEASIGVIVIWDKKTSVSIKLAPSYRGTVCGLCGNFDQRSSNDFTTRDHVVVDSALDFGNSWKEAPTCPDVNTAPEPCALSPHRRSWAEKQCSIIKTLVFGVCHSKVDPMPFYEACVHDSCSCDTTGDCGCFCLAVASYAQECTKVGACVFWRKPDLCPIFCDYYNPPRMCPWHYEPCGNSFKTCRTVNGVHSNISVSYLEGCYPRCPEESPIYAEDLKKCVTRDQCGCYINDTYYPPGESVPTEQICQSCVCNNSSQVVCQPEEGKILTYTQDSPFCYWEICGPDGTVRKDFSICVHTSPPSSPSTPSTTTSVTPITPSTTTRTTATASTGLCCFWSDWINDDHPRIGSDGGDRETFNHVCRAPENIECRSAIEPHLSWEKLGQEAQCNVSFGFICKNEDQFGKGPFEVCYDYEIRVYCCLLMDECPTTPTMSPPTTTSTETPITTTTETPTTTPTTTSTGTPTPTPTTKTPTTTPTTTSTGTSTPTPTTSTTETPTPTTIETPTPTATTTSTGTPTPTPTTTTTETPSTTTTESPTPTATTTSTGTPSPTPTTHSSHHHFKWDCNFDPQHHLNRDSNSNHYKDPNPDSHQHFNWDSNSDPQHSTHHRFNGDSKSDPHHSTHHHFNGDSNFDPQHNTHHHFNWDSNFDPQHSTHHHFNGDSNFDPQYSTHHHFNWDSNFDPQHHLNRDSNSNHYRDINPNSHHHFNRDSNSDPHHNTNHHFNGDANSDSQHSTHHHFNRDSNYNHYRDPNHNTHHHFYWDSDSDPHYKDFKSDPHHSTHHHFNRDSNSDPQHSTHHCFNGDSKSDPHHSTHHHFNWDSNFDPQHHLNRDSSSNDYRDPNPDNHHHFNRDSNSDPHHNTNHHFNGDANSDSQHSTHHHYKWDSKFDPQHHLNRDSNSNHYRDPNPDSHHHFNRDSDSDPQHSTHHRFNGDSNFDPQHSTHHHFNGDSNFDPQHKTPIPTTTETPTPTATTTSTGTPTPTPTTTQTTTSTGTPTLTPSTAPTTTSTGTPITTTTETPTTTPTTTSTGTPTPTPTTSTKETPSTTTTKTPTPTATTTSTGTPTPTPTTAPTTTSTGTPTLTPSTTSTETPITTTTETPTTTPTTTSTGTPTPTPTTNSIYNHYGIPNPYSHHHFNRDFKSDPHHSTQHHFNRDSNSDPQHSSHHHFKWDCNFDPQHHLNRDSNSNHYKDPNPDSHHHFNGDSNSDPQHSTHHRFNGDSNFEPHTAHTTTSSGTPNLTPSTTSTETPIPTTTKTPTPTVTTTSTGTLTPTPSTAPTTASTGTPTLTPSTAPTTTSTGTPTLTPSIAPTTTSTGTPTLTPSTTSTETPIPTTTETPTPTATTTSTGTPTPTPSTAPTTASTGTPTLTPSTAPTTTSTGTPTLTPSTAHTTTSTGTPTLTPSTTSTETPIPTTTETSTPTATTTSTGTPTPTPTTTQTTTSTGTPTLTPSTAHTTTSTGTRTPTPSTAPTTTSTETPITTTTETPTTTPTTTSTGTPTPTPTTTTTETPSTTTTESPTPTATTTSTGTPTPTPTTAPTTTSTGTPTLTPSTTSTETPITTTTETPTTTPTTTSTGTPTPTPTTSTTETPTPTTIETPTPTATTTSTGTPTPTPTTTTTETPSTTTTESPTPTATTTSTGTPSPTPTTAPTTTSTGTPTPTPSTAHTTTSSGTPNLTPSTTSTETPIPTSTKTPTPTATTTSTGTPTPTSTTTPTTTSTGTPTLTPSTSPTTTSTGTPTLTPSTALTTTSTGTPTLTPSTTPTTTSTGTPTLTPSTTSAETPIPTTTETRTPTATTISTGTPTPSPTTTQTTTSTGTPTPTPSTAPTTTSTRTPITTTTETTTTTPTTTSTGTPTPTPTTSTTETPTPTTIETPTLTATTTSTGTPTPTPTTTPTTTSTGTPTLTPSTTSTETPVPTTTETRTPTATTTSTGTPTPTPTRTQTTTSTGMPTLTPRTAPTTTSTGTPTPTPSTAPTTTSTGTLTLTPSTTSTETPITTTTETPTTTPTTTSTGIPTPTPTTSTTETPTPTTIETPTPTATTTSTGTPTPTPITTTTETPSTTTTETPTPTTTTTSTGTPTPTPTTAPTTTSMGTPTPTPSTAPTTTSSGTPPLTPSTTSTETPVPTTTLTPTPTATTTSTGTPTLTPSTAPTTPSAGTPTLTRSTAPTTTSMVTPTLTPSTTSTETPVPTTTETPTPTATTTSTGTPTPTPTTTQTTTSTGTPTPTPSTAPTTTSTGTPTPTHSTATTTTSTGTPTLTPSTATSTTSTGTPTPTPNTATTTTSTGTPTPTPTTTTTETPSTTTTQTPTPTATTTSTGTPTLTPRTAPTTTSTGTPTLTPSTTSTETPIPTTTETPTQTATTTSTGTPTLTPTTTQTTTSTGTPTPTPSTAPTTMSTGTLTLTPSTAPTTTSTGTPTLTPRTTSTETTIPTTTETPTTTPTTYSTGTPTPTPTTTTTETPTTTTTETPTPTSTTTSAGTPTMTPSTAPTTTSTGTSTPTPTTTETIPTTTTTTETPTSIITSTVTPTPPLTTTSTATPTPTLTISTSSTETPTPTPTITETPTAASTTTGTTSPTTTTTTETPTPLPNISTTSRTSKSLPTSSLPTSQSTYPSSTESTMLVTTIPTIVETYSTPQTPVWTEPAITTTGGTTSSPPSPGTTPPGSPTSATSTGTSTPIRHSSTMPPMPQTTSTLTSSVTTPTVTLLTSPNITTTSILSVSTSSQMICCYFNDTYYVPGELVYNTTHGDTCYYVNCSLQCTLEIFNWSCPSTPSPTPSPSTPTPRPSMTSSVPPTTKPPACLDFDPPRQENETWWLCNCTMATCKYNNTVELTEVKCDPPPMPTCSNGLMPVRVEDPDKCCWYWECDCYCTGWGDSHYVTFDGLYYSYQGNCTYVLVEEITPTMDSFGVYIDNQHCDTSSQVSCPRALLVRHETQEVLIQAEHMMPMRVQVQVNRQAVALPYKKYGLQVYQSGFSYVVDIPELGALISYDSLSFSIRLPYRRFGNNTKGRCGTCTNNTLDDCMLPSGEVVANCEVAADHWVLNEPSEPRCPHRGSTSERPATRPSVGSSPAAGTGSPSPLCELIKDSLFARCHTVVPPKHYYEACISDSFTMPNSSLECASLQTYAALCAQEGICVDWRSHTSGVCSVMCPAHREYRACGPVEEPTCKSSLPRANSPRLVEGCFCPEGTTNYAPGFDVCVDLCGCVGPDNVPREFGEHFEFDCKDCVCLEGGSGIICRPKTCHPGPLTECKEDGTYAVTEVDPANACCNITSCKCDTSLCRGKPPLCPLGFEVKSEMVPGSCCPFYSCVPKGVCVLGNAEYQPGSPVFSKCQDCVCTERRDNATQLNSISCTHVPCNTSCGLGFELVDAPGECCKKCQQTQCVISIGQPGSPSLVLKPGDMKSDPLNNCTFFSCMKIHDQFISSISNITCPDFDPSTCLPGSTTLMPNGCCRKCLPRNKYRVLCSTVPVVREISHNGCTKLVSMNDCFGSCGTSAMYLAEAQSLDHKCSCCKEQRTSQREVMLQCPGGALLRHTYTHIDSCLCQDTVCEQPPQRRARRSGPRDLGLGRGKPSEPEFVKKDSVPFAAITPHVHLFVCIWQGHQTLQTDSQGLRLALDAGSEGSAVRRDTCTVRSNPALCSESNRLGPAPLSALPAQPLSHFSLPILWSPPGPGAAPQGTGDKDQVSQVGGPAPGTWKLANKVSATALVGKLRPGGQGAPKATKWAPGQRWPGCGSFCSTCCLLPPPPPQQVPPAIPWSSLLLDLPQGRAHEFPPGLTVLQLSYA